MISSDYMFIRMINSGCHRPICSPTMLPKNICIQAVDAQVNVAPNHAPSSHSLRSCHAFLSKGCTALASREPQEKESGSLQRESSEREREGGCIGSLSNYRIEARDKCFNNATRVICFSAWTVRATAAVGSLQRTQRDDRAWRHRQPKAGERIAP